MISYIKGKILAVESGHIVLETQGVGYKIFVSLASINLQEGDSLGLWTHLAVRENSMDLYGFKDRKELGFFELLIGVPGIGPKSALAIISLATIEVLEKSIASGDTTYLTKVSGIGKKSAEKIVLELKDKAGLSMEDSGQFEEDGDVIDALQSLGYSLRESREALKGVGDEVSGTNDKIKSALRTLGKQKG